MRKIISAILVIFTLLFCLTSCGPVFTFPPLPKMGYPEGYTGGFKNIDDRSETECWWVETYDELMEAVDLLKSHGSTFEKSIISDYDGDLYDTKYCITIDRKAGETEKIKYGDNPFDRKAVGVAIVSYAFFEDVTIDELNYSYITKYDVMTIMQGRSLNEGDAELKFDSWVWDHYDGGRKYILCNDEERILFVSRCKDGTYSEIPDEVLDAVADSLVFIGFE
jgi:predicted small lipoprotein YifL